MASSYVRIHYGPYESFYTYSHKPQKLNGLRFSLQKLGYRVDLVPSELVDLCAIEMCGYEVFRCNIKHLKLNKEGLNDPICQRAIQAVELACIKMERARSYLWTSMLVEGQMFKNEYSPKNYWELNVDFQPFGQTCADCCHIFVQHNSDGPEDKELILNPEHAKESVIEARAKRVFLKLDS